MSGSYADPSNIARASLDSVTFEKAYKRVRKDVTMGLALKIGFKAMKNSFKKKKPEIPPNAKQEETIDIESLDQRDEPTPFREQEESPQVVFPREHSEDEISEIDPDEPMEIHSDVEREMEEERELEEEMMYPSDEEEEEEEEDKLSQDGDHPAPESKALLPQGADQQQKAEEKVRAEAEALAEMTLVAKQESTKEVVKVQEDDRTPTEIKEEQKQLETEELFSMLNASGTGVISLDELVMFGEAIARFHPDWENLWESFIHFTLQERFHVVSEKRGKNMVSSAAENQDMQSSTKEDTQSSGEKSQDTQLLKKETRFPPEFSEEELNKYDPLNAARFEELRNQFSLKEDEIQKSSKNPELHESLQKILDYIIQRNDEEFDLFLYMKNLAKAVVLPITMLFRMELNSPKSILLFFLICFQWVLIPLQILYFLENRDILKFHGISTLEVFNPVLFQTFFVLYYASTKEGSRFASWKYCYLRAWAKFSCDKYESKQKPKSEAAHEEGVLASIMKKARASWEHKVAEEKKILEKEAKKVQKDVEKEVEKLKANPIAESKHVKAEYEEFDQNIKNGTTMKSMEKELKKEERKAKNFLEDQAKKAAVKQLERFILGGSPNQSLFEKLDRSEDSFEALSNFAVFLLSFVLATSPFYVRFSLGGEFDLSRSDHIFEASVIFTTFVSAALVFHYVSKIVLTFGMCARALVKLTKLCNPNIDEIDMKSAEGIDVWSDLRDFAKTIAVNQSTISQLFFVAGPLLIYTLLLSAVLGYRVAIQKLDVLSPSDKVVFGSVVPSGALLVAVLYLGMRINEELKWHPKQLARLGVLTDESNNTTQSRNRSSKTKGSKNLKKIENPKNPKNPKGENEKQKLHQSIGSGSSFEELTKSHAKSRSSHNLQKATAKQPEVAAQTKEKDKKGGGHSIFKKGDKKSKDAESTTPTTEPPKLDDTQQKSENQSIPQASEISAIGDDQHSNQTGDRGVGLGVEDTSALQKEKENKLTTEKPSQKGGAKPQATEQPVDVENSEDFFNQIREQARQFVLDTAINFFETSDEPLCILGFEITRSMYNSVTVFINVVIIGCAAQFLGFPLPFSD